VDSQITLCGFYDASERGYAATIYVRLMAVDGTVSVSLLGTKTKMAPMKSTTIPRLKFCAAVLLTWWMSRIHVILGHKVSVNKMFVWSDSQIVLSWLTFPHALFNVFISNRVLQVQQLLPECSWNYDRSEDNPADCASRGVLPSELSRMSLYWSGPSFLREFDEQMASS